VIAQRRIELAKRDVDSLESQQNRQQEAYDKLVRKLESKE